MTAPSDPSDWRDHGVRIVPAGELGCGHAADAGHGAAAITTARAGAEELWAGTVDIEPNAKTGAHHHGPVESVPTRRAGWTTCTPDQLGAVGAFGGGSGAARWGSGSGGGLGGGPTMSGLAVPHGSKTRWRRR